MQYFVGRIVYSFHRHQEQLSKFSLEKDDLVLYYDRESDRLFNTWINEHDLGHLAGAIPLLVMDVFEHAFMMDYGLKRVDYIKAFVKAIDWDVVSGRI